MSNLTKLDLSGNRIGDEGVRAIFESPYLLSLTEISFLAIPAGKSIVSAISKSKILPRLTKLQYVWNFESNFIVSTTGIDATEIFGSSMISNLQYLSLRGSDIDGNTFTSLFNNPFITNLTSLNLELTSLCKSKELLVLSKSELLSKQLKYLFLEDLNMHKVLGKHEFELICKNFTQLTSLSMKYNVCEEGILSISKYLDNLTYLSLQGGNFSSIKPLCESSAMVKLEVLRLEIFNLDFTQIMSDLSQSRNVTNLKELYLKNTKYNSLTCPVDISLSENFCKVQTLSFLVPLNANNIETIVNSPYLKNLKRLILRTINKEMTDLVGNRFEIDQEQDEDLSYLHL